MALARRSFARKLLKEQERRKAPRQAPARSIRTKISEDVDAGSRIDGAVANGRPAREQAAETKPEDQKDETWWRNRWLTGGAAAGGVMPRRAEPINGLTTDVVNCDDRFSAARDNCLKAWALQLTGEIEQAARKTSRYRVEARRANVLLAGCVDGSVEQFLSHPDAPIEICHARSQPPSEPSVFRRIRRDRPNSALTVCCTSVPEVPVSSRSGSMRAVAPRSRDRVRRDRRHLRGCLCINGNHERQSRARTIATASPRRSWSSSIALVDTRHDHRTGDQHVVLRCHDRLEQRPRSRR